jgi:hypothetical protein
MLPPAVDDQNYCVLHPRRVRVTCLHEAVYMCALF